MQGWIALKRKLIDCCYSEPSEKQIENQILDWLEARKIFAWKAEKMSGRPGFKSRNRHHKNGIPDILGVLPNGQFIAIEVKTATGRLSEDQAKFIQELTRRNVICIVARSLADVADVLLDMGQ
jgi:hypothetical protein